MHPVITGRDGMSAGWSSDSFWQSEPDKLSQMAGHHDFKETQSVTGVPRPPSGKGRSQPLVLRVPFLPR